MTNADPINILLKCYLRTTYMRLPPPFMILVSLPLLHR